MKDQTEIIVLVVVLVLIYTRPSALVRFSSTFIGKLILLAAVVLSSLVSPLSGLLIATLMVLYTEQNYEGFVEGMPASNEVFIIREDYDIDSTELLIRKKTNVNEDVDISKWTTSTHDIISVDETIGLFDEHAKITDAYKAFMIYLKNTPVSSNVLPTGNINIDIYHVDDTKVASGVFTRSDESSSNDISQFMISNDGLTYESGKTRLDILSNSSGGNLETGGYIIISNATNDVDKKYVIDYIDHVISVRFSSGINSPIIGEDVNADIRQLQIVEHSHTHGHVETFEGMDGEETAEKEKDEKEDDETKDAVKNIMDNLDIDGIIDIVKKGSDKKEGFFSAEKKNVGEVAGAFAGESYESEITGVAECTTTICERIHREEQLIRPVNSNEELQRV